MTGERTGTRGRPRPRRATALVRSICVAGLGLSAVAVVSTTMPAAIAAGSTFTVNTVDDEVDADPGDGICDTGTEAPAPDCTLRAAIAEAEANLGHDTIEFAIPGTGPHRIAPVTGVSTTSSNGPGADTAYELIEDPFGLTIDGYSQPGASVNDSATGTNAQIMIEVAGLGPDEIDGFDFRSSFNVVRGIAIFGFQRHIRFFGPNAHSNEVTGNFIGVDATPTVAEGATHRIGVASGVYIEQGAHANRIGRSNSAPEIAPRHRNLIAGLPDKGITMHDAGTSENIVQNNLIGLDPTGTFGIANRGHGVDINVGASDNWVGGFGPGEGNVISGNALSGVEVSHDAPSGAPTSGNVVVNNRIGTSADGLAGPVDLRNAEYGINFEGNEQCIFTCPPDISSNVAIGNLIVGSVSNIIVWKGANATTITHNRIGVLLDGAIPASAPSTREAIGVRAGAFDNVISHNVIAHVERGVHVRPDSPTAGEGAFATYANTLSRNSISDVYRGLGIALYGPDEDAPGEFDQGPLEPHPQSNDGIALPVISSVTTDELAATGCAGCVVEVFVTPEPTCSFCFADYGRGATFVASATADATGDIAITFRSSTADPYVVGVGDGVSITVTDAAGNTSEFSERATATSGAIGPPSSSTTTTTTTTTTIPLPTTTTTSTTTTVPVERVTIEGEGIASARATRCDVGRSC